MAGATDLFGSNNSITGAGNLFKVNKSPLDQINEDVSDVIGKQADSTGGQFISVIEQLIKSILGGDGDFMGGIFADVENLMNSLVNYLNEVINFVNQILGAFGLPNVGALTADIEADLALVLKFFTDLFSFLNLGAGGNAGDLGSDAFEIAEFVIHWITSILAPTNLLAGMDPITQLIDSFNIPGLDASKIISGLFPQSQVAGLEAALEDIWTSVISGDAQGVIDALMSAMGFPPPSDGSDYTAVDLFEGFVKMVLQIGSPLNSLNLFNLVPTDLMALIPMSNIGEALTNLITDGNFLDAGSLALIPGWIHDLTGGFGGKGAMFTDATGIVKELFGNLIPVSEGQIVPISGMAKWTGLIGTGNPIQLAVTGYKDGVAMVQSIIASHNTTPPTTDWLTLTGEFPVPAGIDSIRTRLVVGAGATAGTVGFSNLSSTKIGAMLQRLIRGTNVGEFLPDDIGHLFNGIVSNTLEILDRALQGDFEGLVSTIVGDVQEGFEDVGDRLNSFLDDFSPLNGGNIISDIADDFIPGIQFINDNLVNNLVNLPGTGFTHIQVGQALRTQATAITTMSGQLSQITNQLLTLGVSIIDDFGRLSTSGLGADWITHLLNTNGHIAIPNGHSAEWIPGAGNITNQFLSIFNGAISKTQTDIQNIVAVLSGQAQILGKGSSILTGFNDVWARVSNTTTSLANVTGTRLRFGGNGSVAIDSFINGILTVPIASMPAGSITPPGPGAIVGLVAGFMGDLQTFGAMIGNSTVLIGNAPSNTPVGPNYASSGIGGQATGANGAPGYPVSTAAPAPVFQYTAMDGGKTGAPGASG